MQEAFETNAEVSSAAASTQFVDLTDRQKFEIRDRSISAISRGEDENAIHTELAQRLSAETGKTVTMPQVGATAAWVRIWADQALKAHNLYETVERDALIRAWDTLSEREGDTPEVVERIAQELSITGAQLIAVLDRYEEHLGMSRNPTADEEEETATTEIPNPPAEVVGSTVSASEENTPAETQPEETPTTIREVGTVTGATFNYDNPEKNAWRDFIFAHLCARVPRELRPTKKILCLGGANNLEPKAYIDHGFSPANITSVERDVSIQDRFRESAYALGIQPVVGELRDLCSEERFDIVSLDYTGPIGKDKIFDIMSILLANDALVVMNCEQKREQAIIKKSLWSARHIRSILPTT